MIDHFKLAFDPILPWTALAILAALAVGLSVFGAIRGQRGQIERLGMQHAVAIVEMIHDP